MFGSPASKSGSSSSSSSNQTEIAHRQWEVENRVQNVASDELFVFDQEEQQAILQARPWSQEYV